MKDNENCSPNWVKLIIVIQILIGLCGIGLLITFIWAGIHFIVKFW